MKLLRISINVILLAVTTKHANPGIKPSMCIFCINYKKIEEINYRIQKKKSISDLWIRTYSIALCSQSLKNYADGLKFIINTSDILPRYEKNTYKICIQPKMSIK